MSKKKVVELEHQITRIRDRISDLEFTIAHSDDNDQVDAIKERRRAFDKLRHLQDDLYKTKVDIIGESDAT